MLDFNSFKENFNILDENYSSKKFLLAVSGGVDSMVLASLFEICNLKFEIAHVNYHFRGEDSNLDQKLVEDFCKKNKIKFHLKDISEEEKSSMKSLQNWAREIRYDFFFDILEKENLDFIVTAHHLNDELETFIINLSRGSGIKGLSGIPKNENRILRPLLKFSKEEICNFAQENSLPYREDLTNQKSDYLRNFIRNKISPELLNTNVHFLENFKKSISYLSQTKDFVEEKINEKLSEIAKEINEIFYLNKDVLALQSTFIRNEIFRKFGFDKETELHKIINADTGKVFRSKDYILQVDREEFIISKEIETNNTEIILPEKSTINILDYHFKDQIFPHENFLSWEIDAKKVKLPLILRQKQDGDFFFPAGIKGKKLISKFFKDQKFSILAKQNIWLLCDGNNNILGVIPYRQDRRFAATENTKSIIKIVI